MFCLTSRHLVLKFFKARSSSEMSSQFSDILCLRNDRWRLSMDCGFGTSSIVRTRDTFLSKNLRNRDGFLTIVTLNLLQWSLQPTEDFF